MVVRPVRLSNRRSTLGGLAGLGLCFVPVVVLQLGRAYGHLGQLVPSASGAGSQAQWLSLISGSLGDGPLVAHLGSHLRWDYGAQLASLPLFLALVLMTPLVGYRRRDALLALIPIANVYIAWTVCSRIATLAPHPAVERPTGRGPGGRRAAGRRAAGRPTASRQTAAQRIAARRTAPPRAVRSSGPPVAERGAAR